MTKFGIYTNIKKDIELRATKLLVQCLKNNNLDICYDESVAQALDIKEFEHASNADVMFVLGGDGTILRAARKYILCNLSFLGINLGRIGFLSEIYTKDISTAIKSILDGNYYIDKRMVLDACFTSEENPQCHVALNDVVISKNTISRIIGLDLYINDVLADSYKGDGIIVASPTGSTAYSLSAGGPVISPSVSCLLITPICPHSLYSRSIIVKPSDVVKIIPHKLEKNARISLDGQEEIDFDATDCLEIKKSEVMARFIRFEEKNFFSLLKFKLSLWSTD